MTVVLALLGCLAEAPVAPPESGAAAGKAVAASGAGAPADLPPETDLPYGGEGRWELGGRVLTLADTVLRADGAVVLEHVYHAPLAGPDVLWVPADPGGGDGGIYAVRDVGGQLAIDALVTTGRPDRLVLAPDGATLLYVGGHTGITSLWAISTAGGEPRQITNVGVTRSPTPGVAPAGFVPPPERTAPRFEGDRLLWSARGADWEARWR